MKEVFKLLMDKLLAALWIIRVKVFLYSYAELCAGSWMEAEERCAKDPAAERRGALWIIL
jgi:hypothetical protein